MPIEPLYTRDICKISEIREKYLVSELGKIKFNKPFPEIYENMMKIKIQSPEERDYLMIALGRNLERSSLLAMSMQPEIQVKIQKAIGEIKHKETKDSSYG